MNHLKINLDLYSLALASYNLEPVEDEVIQSILHRKRAEECFYPIFTFINFNPNVNKTNQQAYEWCIALCEQIKQQSGSGIDDEQVKLFSQILYYSFLMHRDRCEDVECEEFYEILQFLNKENCYPNSSTNWFFIERLRLDWIFIMIHRAELSKYNDVLKKHIKLAKQNQSQFRCIQAQLDKAACSVD